MNDPYQPKSPKPSGAVSEVLMALLLVLALAQIALCFNAGADLVRLGTNSRLNSAISTLQADVPAAAHAVTNAGFHSVPTRG